MSSSSDLDALFDVFSNQLKTHLNQIVSRNGSREKEVLNFDKDLHWEKLGLCFQSVSKECTKLAVGFSKPPVPSLEESRAFISSLAEAINVFWAWFDAYPVSQGRAISSELEKVVYRLLDAVLEFIHSVKTDGASESASRLQTTGKVWEICNSFSSVAKDNKSAVIKRFSESYALLDDALVEFEKEISDANFDSTQDDEEDMEAWKKIDKPLFQPCLGLMKAGKRLLKMLKNGVSSKASIDSSLTINQLDEIADLIDKISPCIDDLVLSLYPPTDHQDVVENAKLLGNSMENCIQTAKTHHYIDEQDTQWICFVSKAVQHNLQKLSESITS